jgi:hypothetical protein
MKVKHILLGTTLISISLNAQEWDYNEQSDSSTTVVELRFINTNRVDDLLDKKKRIDSNTNTVTAFRIQIFSGSRSGSTDAKIKFSKLFPNTLIETSYEQPYFKTKVAAYRTRLEAQKALRIYKLNFKSAFIYEEKITIDKL